MAINTSSSALCLNLPSSGLSQVRQPTLITVHPSVLAQILDHHTRRPSNPPSSRVIGTLLGVRTNATGGAGGGEEIEIRSCFGVPHSEDDQHIAVDMDYHKGMMELMGKLMGGRKESGQQGEVIVGWYSSSPTLNPYSALIQNFFSQECAAYGGQAVHLTVDADLAGAAEGKDGLGVKAYVSSQVGVNPKPENCVFLPVPCALKYNMSERAGLDLLTPSASKANPALPPLATLSESLSELSKQLETIQAHVASINNGTNSSPADPEVGRYLLEAVGRWKADASATGATSEEDGEQGVKKGLQELLSVSYLSTLLRSQVELSARLNLLT